MKLCYTALAVVLATGLVTAQNGDNKSKMKVKVDDGKTVTVTGCVERAAEGGYRLTNVAGKRRRAAKLHAGAGRKVNPR